MSIPREKIIALSKYVEEELTYRACDGTNRAVRKWMLANGVKQLPVPKHFCDCEVLLNVDDLLTPVLFQVIAPEAQEVSLWEVQP